MKSFVQYLVIASTLAASSLALAQTTRPSLSATLGFSNIFKPDNWTPVYARISDADAPRPVTIEVRTARGKLGHDVVARVTTTRTPTTYTLYAPVGYLDHLSLQLRDESGKLLRNVDLTETAAATPAALGGPAIGVAGPDADALRITSQLVAATGEYVGAGRLPLSLLPERAIGYSDIDALVLPALDVDAIDDDVQRAILAWVRSGGILITWPGPQAPTRLDAPLVAAMPAEIGAPSAINFQGYETTGRMLSVKGADAGPIASRRSGLGQIVLLAFDPSLLPAPTPAARLTLWRTLTAGELSMLPEDRLAGVFDPLVPQAVGEQQLAAAADSPRPWPTRVLPVALLVGLLLGPGELILLAAGRRHPRTWYTLAGVGVLAGCGAWWLLTSDARRPSQQPAITVRVEVPDGLAADIGLSRSPDPASDVSWLTADRSDPTRQFATELRLDQRAERFNVAGITALNTGSAGFRTIRFAGATLHPAHIGVDAAKTGVGNVSNSAWESVAVVQRDDVRLTPGTVPPGQSLSFQSASPIKADNPSTRRIETGIERLATEPGWEAILIDRRISERLVRLLETEPGTTIIAARDEGGVSFTLQVIRSENPSP